jgi:rubrerythrin
MDNVVSVALKMVESAIKIEKEGVKFYSDAASKTKNLKGKEALLRLAKAEEDHLNSLEDERDSLIRTGHWIKSRKLKPIMDINFDKIIPLPKKDATEFTVDTDELTAVEVGIKTEKEVYEYYMKTAEKLVDEDGKAFFKRLAEAEKQHIRLLEAELDYLRKVGYWFDFREFNLETF